MRKMIDVLISSAGSVVAIALIVLAGAGPSFTLATAVTPFANPAEIQATLSRMFFLGGLEPDNCLQLWLNCEVASGSKAPSAHAGQKSGSYTFAFSQCTESNL